jgi:signal transduction histidine kinase
MYVFFPFTLIAMLYKKATKNIKVPITIKMLMIYSLVFTVMLLFFTIFYLSSVSEHLSSTPEAVEYLHALRITTGILDSVFIVVFSALIAVVSSIMLHPIRKMSAGIDRITGENLSARLDIIDSQDELMELTDRINGMLDNIEESFLRQQNFVSDASHELKTPISVIAGYSNMLKRWGMKDEAVLGESIDSIAREAANMKRIVDQLLLLARLGKMNMTTERFNLCEVLDDMVEGYRMVSKAHKIFFKGEDGIFLVTDKNLLLESVRTLVDNAIKYTPEGGKITVECRTKGESALINVSDTGIGISREDIPRLFDRFFRCDKARGRETGSSGLGLTIAKSIIDMIGGEILVESKVGKGSTFTIALY